jgi:hypothetical protein
MNNSSDGVVDQELDALFASLAAFDWGGDDGALAAIDGLIVAVDSSASQRADLERRLGEILSGDASRAAKDYACRRLCLIGTAASVGRLAPLLRDAELSHMARYALERIEAPEAGAAILAAVEVVSGDLKLGMISSLAARRDATAVPVLVRLLESEPTLARAAAVALGRIGTAEAATALASAKPPMQLSDAFLDARVTAGESLLAAGNRAAAETIFRGIAAAVGERPATRRQRAVRCAARAGLIACLDDTPVQPT